MTLHSTICPFESQVVRAAQAAGDAAAAPQEPSLAAHVAGCASCRELFDVARAMTRLAAVTHDEASARTLPAAGQIWWKAQVIQRWQNEARATAPVDLMQRTEVVGGLLAGVALLVTLWPEVHKLESPAVAAQQWWPALARFLDPSSFNALNPLIMGGVALLCGLAVFTLHQFLPED